MSVGEVVAALSPFADVLQLLVAVEIAVTLVGFVVSLFRSSPDV